MFIVTHNGHQSMSQGLFQRRIQDDKELLKLEPSWPNCRPLARSFPKISHCYSFL